MQWPKGLLSVVIIVLVFSSDGKSQELSAGIYGGVMAYQGDLVDGIIDFAEIQPAVGLNLKYRWFKDLALSGNLIFGKLSGNDANSEKLAPRGLSFESNVIEGSIVAEYHPIGQGRWNRKNELIKSISPYVYGGVGFTFGEPETVGLPPESEDLQNNTTARLSIPFGIGVQGTFSEKFYIALEGGSRYVPDDYLDGVSFAGNPDAKDWYITAGIKIGFYLTGEPSMF